MTLFRLATSLFINEEEKNEGIYRYIINECIDGYWYIIKNLDKAKEKYIKKLSDNLKNLYI